MSDQSMKKDAGKPRVELVDPEFVLDLARVLTKGAEKYSPELWRRGIHFSRVLGGMERHLLALKASIDVDPEWGLLHTGHLAAGTMFLHTFLRTGAYREFDNRPYTLK